MYDGRHVHGVCSKNLSKKSEALSTVEERLKSTQVELQKCKMDLEAKGSECQVCKLGCLALVLHAAASATHTQAQDQNM